MDSLAFRLYAIIVVAMIAAIIALAGRDALRRKRDKSRSQDLENIKTQTGKLRE